MATTHENIITDDLKRFIGGTMKNAARVTQRTWQDSTKFLTGRARASIHASIGRGDESDSMQPSIADLLARKDRGDQMVDEFTLDDNEIHIQSTIPYAHNAFPAGSIETALLEGAEAGANTRQGET